MLQKYFPIIGEVNSPLAMLAALNFTSEAAKVAIDGISNSTLETLLWAEVSETSARKAEIEVSIAELAAIRKAASKELRTLRYRAACAARAARRISKTARRIKASRRPVTSKISQRSLSGLSLETCRQRAASAQVAVRSVTTVYNTAAQAVESAIQGGDIRVIRSSVAALKAATRLLEVRHVEYRFAREMLSISLARHSA